ncbi:MAG TPA: TM2 domain-containing protein [Candidatus Krumholzibacteria bacterium]|nr:TM2 domain-containing protein [Candidatus Krumholzibacteria bacterium]
MSSLYHKQNLTPQQLQLFESEMSDKRKSSGISFVLWFFLGLFGGHRFYLGQVGPGVLMLLTGGGLGLWWLIDLFLLSGMVSKVNDRTEAEVLQSIQLYDQAQKNEQAPELVGA